MITPQAPRRGDSPGLYGDRADSINRIPATGRSPDKTDFTTLPPTLIPRMAEMAAIFMVGDGLVALVQPRRHVDLWKENALGAEKTVAPFVNHPGRRRIYALVQIAAGLALAARQRKTSR